MVSVDSWFAQARMVGKLFVVGAMPKGGFAGSRFLAHDAHAIKTRSARGRQRKKRADAGAMAMAKKPVARREMVKKPMLKKPAQRRAPAHADRHRHLPCCGRLRKRCKCDWSMVEQFVDWQQWESFVQRIGSSSLLFARDTGDVGSFLPMFNVCEGQHCVMEGEKGGDFRTFLFRMFVLRRYNRMNVWMRLVPSIPPKGTPDWKALGMTLKDLFSSGNPTFSGTFRPTHAKAARSAAGKMKSVEKLPAHVRELALWKAVHPAVPPHECKKFAACPDRQNYVYLYDALKANLQNAQHGAIGDYAIKGVLDMAVL